MSVINSVCVCKCSYVCMFKGCVCKCMCIKMHADFSNVKSVKSGFSVQNCSDICNLLQLFVPCIVSIFCCVSCHSALFGKLYRFQLFSGQIDLSMSYGGCVRTMSVSYAVSVSALSVSCAVSMRALSVLFSVCVSSEYELYGVCERS